MSATTDDSNMAMTNMTLTPPSRTISISHTTIDESSSQSSLSSVPSEIGSSPEDLKALSTQPERTNRSGSPVSRRSTRTRKISGRVLEPEIRFTDSSNTTVKRRKVSPTKSMRTSLKEVSLSTTGSVTETTPTYSTDRFFLPYKPVVGEQSQSSPDHDNDSIDFWPESNLRSQPLPLEASFVSPPDHISCPEDASIELDIQSSFCAKIRQQHYISNTTSREKWDYVTRFSPRESSIAEVTEIEASLRDLNTDQAKSGWKTTSGTENGSNHESAAPSPSDKAGKPGSTAKNGKGTNKAGKQKGRTGGNGGRDKESPEPNEKAPKTNDDQALLKSIRQRQLELKRFYSIVGGQQMEALEIMTSRDLSKVHKKSATHTKVPEHDEILQSLEAKENEVRSLINHEYQMRRELAEQALQAQKQIIESSFVLRAKQARSEHLKGAEGDLMILRNAHISKIDETRTDNGSEGASNFPLYHELPEPNTRVRGYSSTRVDDEKPFKENLASYDEQAQREVIDDDIVAPVMQSVARQNAEHSAEVERISRQKLDQLADLSTSELKNLDAQLKTHSQAARINPQFNLSRLADCADLVSQRDREQQQAEYLTSPKEISYYNREYDERPLRPFEEIRRISTFTTPSANPALPMWPTTPVVRRNKSLSIPTRRSTKDDEQQSQSSSNTSTPLLNIAPAPSRMPPPPSSSQHHHHHLPPPQMPPPPSSSFAGLPSFIRHKSLTPIRIPNAPPVTSPDSRVYNQGVVQPANVPPPPSSFQHRPNPLYAPPQSTHAAPQYPILSQPSLPPPPPIFSTQHPQPQLFEPQPPSPVDMASAQSPSHPSSRPEVSNITSLRPSGQRRNSGQITFTPAQTPSSERFTRPAGPAPQLPGRSVIRPAQFGLTTSAATRLGNVINAAPEARAQTAADIARENAVKNQVQGAGPKGGRRVLLPKSH